MTRTASMSMTAIPARTSRIASLSGLDRVSSRTFSLPELRSILGITAGKLDRFADVHRRALQPAVDEINHLSRFTLTLQIRDHPTEAIAHLIEHLDQSFAADATIQSHGPSGFLTLFLDGPGHVSQLVQDVFEGHQFPLERGRPGPSRSDLGNGAGCLVERIGLHGRVLSISGEQKGL